MHNKGEAVVTRVVSQIATCRYCTLYDNGVGIKKSMLDQTSKSRIKKTNAGMMRNMNTLCAIARFSPGPSTTSEGTAVRSVWCAFGGGGGRSHLQNMDKDEDM